ncbi:MOSC domain-containing protein [Nonomuraea pusilla]|uniref:MOSC domain-containing protein n=1 Tax=Nonomuraea pusilla TaxID=46177 RepID=A0A1H7W727_9ACTN|nr:MOSC domain-containing protein [Nonomuraea pusilla]SEM17154.1 hypothetical protein SAMN05660976_04383 [Nonomuraea pusilla]
MRIRTIFRYPVKSMLGEEVAESGLSARGLDGDRARAVLDVATGLIASAKNPRLWRGLLAVEGAAAPGDEELSALLGREVRLVDVPPGDARLERSVPEEVLDRGVEAEVPATLSTLGGAAPEGTFFDFAPIHLVTTSTLAAIGALSPRGVVEAVRYRPNLVVETGGWSGGDLGGGFAEAGGRGGGDLGGGFAENAWVGRELRVGEDAVLEVIAPSPRCAVPTLEHGGLGRDPEALRVPARHNRVPVLDLGPHPCAGVYARVVEPGRIRRGDPVRLVPGP